MTTDHDSTAPHRIYELALHRHVRATKAALPTTATNQ